MDTPNAFIGHTGQPTPEEVSAALAETATLWDDLITWLANVKGVSDQEWKSSGAKYGWSLKLKLKKRTILYLGPCADCFRVAFVLGDRAVEAARESDLSKELKEALAAATRYPEGTGLRLLVRKSKDLAGIRKLTALKLEN